MSRLNRRRYLSELIAGGIAAVAGCATTTQNRSPTRGDRTRTSTSTPTSYELPVSRDEFRSGAPIDFIPAITEPAFSDTWSEIEYELVPDDRVIGVDFEGQARAYPLRILLSHEIVNDTIEEPILVTYCPLCLSGMVAIREVGEQETIFGVSGLLWRENLVMYDEKTKSLWSQIDATAIRGSATGETLELIPSTLTSWREWESAHPNTNVLLPPPASNTVRGREATKNYIPVTQSQYKIKSGYPVDVDYDPLHPYEMVIGVSFGGETRAYPYESVLEHDVINDEVGGVPIVVAIHPDDTMVAYVRRIGDETLRFTPNDEPGIMTGGGSRWSMLSAQAIDGPFEGKRLIEANDKPAMAWFAWGNFRPDTTVYGS